LVANSQKKKSFPREDGQEEQVREGVGANQGPDDNVVFEFELLAKWVPKEPEDACSVVTDGSTVAATSLTPKDARVSGGISMPSFLARNK
jgi:hypothetical protein